MITVKNSKVIIHPETVEYLDIDDEEEIIWVGNSFALCQPNTYDESFKLRKRWFKKGLATKNPGFLSPGIYTIKTDIITKHLQWWKILKTS